MRRTALILLAAALSEACASAPEPAPQTAEARPRRRRRRTAPATDAPADGAATPASPSGAPATVTDAAPAAPPVQAPGLGAAQSGALMLPPTVRHVETAPTTPPAGGAFGSPVVAQRTANTLTPRWAGSRAAPRVLCEGEAPAQRASTQAPYDPTRAMLSRAFDPLEPSVLACNPPCDAEGHYAVRVVFSGGGLPQEVLLPTGVTRAQSLCIATALCGARLTAFRAPDASVNWMFTSATATGQPVVSGD